MENNQHVMRCKLKLHTLQVADSKEQATVKFGAVWEGTTEAQQASENAIFGKWTPYAEFNSTIMNPEVIQNLELGAEYYVDFIKVVK